MRTASIDERHENAPLTQVWPQASIQSPHSLGPDDDLQRIQRTVVLVAERIHARHLHLAAEDIEWIRQRL